MHFFKNALADVVFVHSIHLRSICDIQLLFETIFGVTDTLGTKYNE
jgi:hypothetical protein